MALKAADSGDESESFRLLLAARSKSSSLVARRAAEDLTLVGTAGQKIESALYLAKNYGDDDALLIACQTLKDAEEYAKIIEITEKLDLEQAPNKLVKMRLDSMIKKEDSRFEKEFYKWMTCRPISNFHSELYNFYLSWKMEKFVENQQKQFLQFNKKKAALELEKKFTPENANQMPELAPPPAEEMPVTDEHLIMAFRIKVFRKDYVQAFNNMEEIIGLYKNAGKPLDFQILSDLGKAALYGTNDFFTSAARFDNLAKELEVSDKEAAYYAWFYSARLFDKAGRYQNTTIKRFESALEATTDPEKFDNCLWYLLNMELRTSTDDILSTLQKYSARISDKSYFDDFFESLSILLLSNHSWQEFYKVWKAIDGKASEEVSCKFAYISGRLLEDGLATGSEGLRTRQAVEAFTRVLNGNADLYYKVCAIERLNITDKKIVEDFLLAGGTDEKKEEDADARRLLEGYAAFGFPQKIYSEWLKNRKNLSLDTNIRMSRFLKECGEHENIYSVQSLRIAGWTKANFNSKIPADLLQLNFPRLFLTEVSSAANENNLPEYALYALIRSESFFDPNIVSSAGAIGLTQLMPTTAEDTARKLKMNSYDEYDAQDNIRLGAKYLADLIERAGESPLLALFAYNAGLTHVRRWLRASYNDWSTTGRASMSKAGFAPDLFLETLPFSETREYGRKLVSAAAMYGFLYYGITPAKTVQWMMQ